MSWWDSAMDDAARLLLQSFRIALHMVDRSRRLRPGLSSYRPTVLEFPDTPSSFKPSMLRKFAIAMVASSVLYASCYGIAALIALMASIFQESDCLGMIVLMLLLAGVVYVGRNYRESLRKAVDFFRTGFSPRYPTPAPLDLKQVNVYHVALPRSSEWDAPTAHRFISHLLTTFGAKLAFQIIAQENGISWRIIDLRMGLPPDLLESEIRSFYPQAAITHTPYTRGEFREPFFRAHARYTCTRIFPAPLRSVGELKEFDPLIPLTQAMNELQEEEQVTYTVYVADYTPDAEKVGRKMITTSNINLAEFGYVAGWVDAPFRALAGADRVDAYKPDLQRVMEEKLSYPLFHTLLVVQADAPTEERAGQLAIVSAHVQHFENPPFNELAIPADGVMITRITNDEQYWRTDIMTMISDWLTNRDQSWKDSVMVLEPREIAALWHLPHKGFQASSILWLPGRSTPLPRQLEKNREHVCLGDNLYAGKQTPVYMRNEDRASHMIVFGKTEMGKSTLLHNLVHQDIEQGRGVAVVDPHGNLVRDILRTSIPPERESDVVVWDLAAEDYPPPMNLLKVPERYDRTQAVAQVMSIFEKMYDDFGATRMAYTLSMALSTLTADETPTLLDISRVFRDGDYRWRLVEKLDDPDIEMFWEDFERRTARDQDELILPILRRLNVFTASPALKPILCHPQNLDFVSLIRENRIILISLRSGEAMHLPPYSQQFLGAVLVSQFQLAVMAGAARTPFYLYVDEAQNFVTTAIPEIFNEARKRGLSLTLANQFLRQLTGDTLDAVMGNVGAMVVFQCGEPDARAVASYMKPNFNVEDLVQLDKHQAAVFMRFGKEQLPAFSLNTRPAPQPPSEAAGQEIETRIRAHSRAQYTPMSRTEVMDWLAARYPRRKRPPQADPNEPFSDPLE